MERISNNSIRILLIACSFLYSVSSNAQIEDWIANKVKGYIYDKVNDVLNSTNSYMGSFGSTLYEGIVEAKTESDLKEKMEEFKQFEPSKLYLDNIESKYGYSGVQSDYSKIITTESKFIYSTIHSKNNISLYRLANGKLNNDIQKYSEEIDRQLEITSLSSVLSKVVLDSITALNPDMESLLLSDIRKNRKLAFFFNSYPEAIRIYQNTIEVEYLRVSIPHLYYWSTQADSHREKLPSKIKIIDPRQITFVVKSDVTIMYNNVELGTIDDNHIICKSLDLLNFCGMPNTVYELENQSYETDAVGRIKEINQIIGKNYKGKNKMKSKLKSKDFVSFLSKSEKPMLLSPASTKYKAAETLLNTCFVENTKENKDVIKQMKTAEKANLKQSSNIDVKTIVIYNNGDFIPSCVKTTYQNGNDYFVLTNRTGTGRQYTTTVSPKTKKEEISFINSLK